MAEIAALADVDVTASELERRIRPYAFHLFDRVFKVEQRNDFDEATDRDHEQDADDQDDRVFFKNGVFLPEQHCQTPSIPPAPTYRQPARRLPPCSRFSRDFRPLSARRRGTKH